MNTPFGSFGLPADAVAWSALAASGACLAGATVCRRRARDWIQRLTPRSWVAAMAGLAAALSIGYVAIYLRWGPRIVDATTYWLQARALAHGLTSFPIPEPSGSFRGRFLITADGRSLSGIFPPGYPAILALGFLAKAPLLVGPLIGAGLVVATAALTRRLFEAPEIARLAAMLSALSAALRYHTADTMSHGWAALLFVTALLFSVKPGRGEAALSGLATGWLVATRPLTGIVALSMTASAAVRARKPTYLVGLLPPLALLAVYEHAVTGRWFASAQHVYYSLADGPPGCFRFGFGSGIGCRFEHGDFVHAHLEHGYGVAAALGTTFRRLALHLGDVANCELLFLLVPFAAFAGRRDPVIRRLSLATIATVAAYSPFYFDGNYPGGGARMLADVLPFEHVLMAWGAVELALERWLAPIALAGFAVHGSHGARSLAEREGGRPMYEPSVLAGAGIGAGLVFVSTDHGFNLGHDPGHADALHGIVVARRTHDGREAALWRALGRPATYRYDYDPGAAVGEARVTRFAIAASPRFEGEHEWPPLEVSAGWAHPAYAAAACASGGRGLLLEPAADGARVTVELPAVDGPVEIVVGWVAIDRAQVSARVGHSTVAAVLSPEAPCSETPRLQAKPGDRLVLSSTARALFDYVEVYGPLR